MANLSFSSQGATPMQNVLNKAKGTKPFNAGKPNTYSSQANPVKAFDFALGRKPDNAGYLGGVTVKKPATQVTQPATPAVNQPSNTSVSSPSTTPTYTGMINNNQQQTPPAPTQGTAQYYANNLEEKGNINPQEQALLDEQAKLRGVYSDRVGAPYGDFGIGQGQKRLSDYELARYNTQLTGIGQQQEGLQNALNRGVTAGQGLLTSSLPQTMGPTDMAYNPLGDVSQTNQQNLGTGGNRVFNAGQLAGQQGLGQQSVEFGAKQSQLNNLVSSLGASDVNGLQIAPVNNIINKLRSGISDQEVANFQATIGAVASILQQVNPELAAQITNPEQLKNMQAQTLIGAIQTAQQALASQQSAVNQYGGGNNNSGGNTGGGVVNTSVGQINTNW